MHRRRWWSLLIPMLGVGCSSQAMPEPVWIGQLVPSEGGNRTFGQHARQGVELAVTEARDAEQTIQGRPCAVLHVDSRDDADAIRAETVRLLTVNKAVALLADFDAVSTEALLRASRSYGAPVVVPGELPVLAESDTVLSLGVPPGVRGRLLARHASTDLKLSRAAVLTDSRRPIAADFASAFLKAWPRDSGCEEWTFTTAAERDERLTQLVRTSPAIVVLACSVADFRLLRPRLAETLPNTPLIYGGEDAGIVALQADLEMRSAVYLATVYSTDHLSDAGRAFAQRYRERFHESPDLFAAQCYDATRLLFDSLRHEGMANRETLGKEFAQRESFESVTGPIRWKDRQPRRRIFVVSLQKNKSNVVSTVDPDEN